MADSFEAVSVLVTVEFIAIATLVVLHVSHEIVAPVLLVFLIALQAYRS